MESLELWFDHGNWNHVSCVSIRVLTSLIQITWTFLMLLEFPTNCWNDRTINFSVFSMLWISKGHGAMTFLMLLDEEGMVCGWDQILVGAVSSKVVLSHAQMQRCGGPMIRGYGPCGWSIDDKSLMGECFHIDNLGGGVD